VTWLGAAGYLAICLSVVVLVIERREPRPG